MKYPSKKHRWVIPINTRKVTRTAVHYLWMLWVIVGPIFFQPILAGSIWVPALGAGAWVTSAGSAVSVAGTWRVRAPDDRMKASELKKIEQQNMSQVTRFKMSSAVLPQRTHKFQDWRSWPRISRYPFIFIHLSYSCTSASAAFSAAAFSAAASSAAAVAAAAFLAASSFHPSSRVIYVPCYVPIFGNGNADLQHCTMQKRCSDGAPPHPPSPSHSPPYPGHPGPSSSCFCWRSVSSFLRRSSSSCSFFCRSNSCFTDLYRSLQIQIFTVLMVHAARTRKRSRWQKISKTLLRDSFAGSWDRPGTGYHMVGFGSKHRSTDAVFVWPCSSSMALCHLNGSTEGWRPFGLWSSHWLPTLCDSSWVYDSLCTMACRCAGNLGNCLKMLKNSVLFQHVPIPFTFGKLGLQAT